MQRRLFSIFFIALLGAVLSGCAIYPYQLEVPIPVLVVKPGYHHDNDNDDRRDRRGRREHDDDD